MILRTRTICIDSLVSVNVSGMQFCMPLFLICFLTLCFFISLLIFRSRILRHAIPIYLIPANRIGLSAAKVTAIPLNGVNVSAIAAFYNSNMISAAVAVPVKEYNVSGSWLVLSASPLTFLLEPAYSVSYKSEFWNNTCLYISTLVCTP